MEGARAKAWRCFHCDEVFVDQHRAAAHFGNFESAPACKISDEDVRRLEQELARYRAEDSDLDRAYHAMQADHAVALRREEEKGYAQGLADGKREALADLDKASKEPTPETNELRVAALGWLESCSVGNEHRLRDALEDVYLPKASKDGTP
jgi:hypothetical protein